MPNRRDFILQTAAAGGVLALSTIQAPSTGEAAPAVAKSLRILILGGTGFIGPHFVRAAVDRGHKVSVFSRGRDDADLSSRVERLKGDRDGDLESIKNRDWDAIFDLATYVPNWVRTLGEALEGRVNHYTFISTAMVYEFPGATDEGSKPVAYTDTLDPYSATSPGKQYGPLKVLCEREAEKQFPGKALVLRPGHIVGPRERVGAFTYWVARMERGGEVLVGGDPLTQVQLIDVRDLAEWAVRMTEQGNTGVFNTVGPALPLGWGEMLGALRGAFSVPTRLTWVPITWLMDWKPKPIAPLFWPADMVPGFTQLNNNRARANGLTFRPLNSTIADTLAWYKGLSSEQQREVLLAFDEKRKSLEDAMVGETEILAAWRAQEKSR